jgi:AcrR family transcriptional regulator
LSETRRERLRESTREEIKAIARRHMAEQGTAAMSLRAIARDMGMTAPALYRYYIDRDALITALILDAFNALADALVAADATRARGDYTGRMMAVLVAYREWALTHPTDFQLIYGNPIPGYEAPREVTVPAVVRGFSVVLTILKEASTAGQVDVARQQRLPPPIEHFLIESIQRDGYAVSPWLLYVAVVGWTRIYGIILLELFNHLQPVIGDIELFYQFEAENLFRQMGLKG